MTAISWKNAANGDWNTASNWSTNTVPGGNDDAAISASGPYIVTVSSADLADTLTFNASQAALIENAGSLTMAGALTVDSGFVSLNEANTIGSVALAGGVLAFGNGGALGAGTLALSGGGELIATANETFTNALQFSGTSTIAAGHGTTLNENSSGYVVSGNSTLNFGALGQDGTILWHTGNSSALVAPDPIINVQAGTFEGADSLFDFLLGNATQIAVAAGATLDVAGNSTFIENLQGAGTVTNSGAAATLTVAAANFSGGIAGPLSLVAFSAVVLSGANTYTGTTTINSAESLELGVGGATGSIGGGAIGDAGTLYIDRNNALTLTNAISGAGVLRLVGTGVTSINTANTYSGGTIVSAGTLAIGNGGALGAGAVSLSGGELLTTANETLANVLQFSGTSTIAVAHGTTLDENAPRYQVSANSTLNFGALGQDGTILWHTGNGSSVGSPDPSINVLAGTLEGADSSFDFLIGIATQVTVAAGATLDWAGSGGGINILQGAGTVTNSGAAQTMSLGGTNFSGTISGALSLTFAGNTSLSGLEDYTGGATLEGAITVANTGIYDMVANQNITGTPVSMFVNNGLFEKTGGGGVSDVTSNFVNNGTLDVQSGSMQFSGGFTNNGLIHGLVTQSGGVTTISNAPNYVAMGGGETIDFADNSGDVASLYNTAGDFDTVNGSNGTVYLNSAQTNVVGGDDTIYFLSESGNWVGLNGTGGIADTVYGSNGTIYMNGAQANLVGGDQTIDFSNASGNAVVLYGTSYNFDNVYGSGGTVSLESAQTTVTGGGDAIYFAGGAGNAASLYGAGGSGDAVYGASGTVYLTSAQASIVGGSDTVYFSGGSGNSANLSGTGGNSDTLYGSNGTVYLTSAQVSVVAGSDTIYFYGGSGNTASLFGAGGHSDTVYGSNGTVDLTSAQVSVVGGGDTTYFSGGTGNVASLFGTNGVWDTVYGSNSTVDLTSAQTSVRGGGETVYFSGGSGNVASLYDTGGVWDSVYGASGTLALTGAQASVIGNGNSIDFYGTSNWLSASGGSEAFVFQPAIGQDTINGFAASDSMTFSASDFANFAALSPHISQSGSNTLISLDANDTVTLTNTTASSLTSSQFHFV